MGVQDIVDKKLGAMSVAEQLRSVPAVPPSREWLCDAQLCENVKDMRRGRKVAHAPCIWYLPRPRWGDDARLAPATFWSLSN